MKDLNKIMNKDYSISYVKAGVIIIVAPMIYKLSHVPVNLIKNLIDNSSLKPMEIGTICIGGIVLFAEITSLAINHAMENKKTKNKK